MFGNSVIDAYFESYDFHGSADTRIRYMIAAIPRSGSTLLSHLLWKSGVLGAPLEYLNSPLTIYAMRRLGFSEINTSYWDAIQQIRSSPNGVFGWKMFWANYIELATTRPDFIPHIRADRVVFISRRDKILQAVSYAKANKTGIWFKGARGANDATISEVDIEQAYYSLIAQERYWDAFFQKAQVVPLRLSYEDICADPVVAVSEVARHLDVSIDGLAQLEYVRVPDIQRSFRDAALAAAYYASWIQR